MGNGHGIMETIGQRLKHIRQGISPKAMAEKLGIPQQTLSSYESGKHNPDLLIVDKIYTMLGVKTDWLLFGRGPVYDEDKVHLVHARVGGGINALQCGQPSSTVELRPEYRQELDRIAALEARAVELEKQLANARDAKIRAKDKALEAKNEALEAMRALAFKRGNPGSIGAPKSAPNAPLREPSSKHAL